LGVKVKFPDRAYKFNPCRLRIEELKKIGKKRIRKKYCTLYKDCYGTTSILFEEMFISQNGGLFWRTTIEEAQIDGEYYLQKSIKMHEDAIRSLLDIKQFEVINAIEN